MKLPDGLIARALQPGRIVVSSLLEGQDAILLPQLAQEEPTRGIVFVCRDDSHLATLADQLNYFAPKLDVIRFPPGIVCLMTGFLPPLIF